jgi:RHS repeat-associated protein
MKLLARSHLRRFFRESVVATMIATMILPSRLPAEECDCEMDSDCEAGYQCIDGVCEGPNVFSVVTGNARRRILDLRVLGAVSGALEWKRYHNSVPRPGLKPFGTAGCWRHIWQYELLGSASGGAGGRELVLVFPWGNQVVFMAGANGTWTTRSPLQERLEVRTNGAEVVTHEGHRLNFVRQNRAGIERYELATHTDAYGVVTALEYDAAGNLVRVREPAGRELTLNYTTIAGHAGALISQVTGSDGRSVSYRYETLRAPAASQEFASLTQARYGDSTSASYSYAFVRADAQPLLVEADDPRYLGTAKRIGYTYQGPLGTIREELNPKTGAVLARLILDPALPTRRVVSYSDLRQVSFEISADGLSVVSRTDSLGRTVRFERDELRRITAKVEHGGRRTEFSWDAASRKLREKRPGQTERRIERDSAGRATKETDPHGRVTISERNAAGRVIRERFHDGTTKETIYDPLGFVTETRERDGAVHRYRRNADHLVAEYVDPTGQVHRYAYDAAGRKTSNTDPLGRVTRFEYNDRGDVTKTTLPDELTSLRAYDAYGQLVSTTDQQGRTTRFAYDDLGRIVRREDPVGGVTTYDYAELPKGCGSCSLSARPTRIVAPDGTVTANLYDTEGRLLSTTVAQGTAAQATTTFVYDDDNLIARTDPLGHVTRYTYDDHHHRLTQTDPLGRVTRWSYDARGNLLSQTAPDGAVTKNTYDLADRRVSTTDANGATTTFTYDAAGRQTSLTDARGNTYRFTFDALGRKTAMIYPDDSRETWSYTAAGQLATYTTRAGQVKTASYDTAGRLLAENWLPSGAAPDVSYGYDSNGRVVSVSNGVSTLRYTYDCVGRMASETSDLSALLPGAPSRTVGYAYDVLGRRTQLVYPDGTVVKQSYDARGKLVAVATADANPIATWSYDAAGRTAAIARANGVATTYSYDAAGQLLEVAHRKGDAMLALARYTLDAVGRRVAQTREDSITETYGYDAIGQLTTVDYGTPSPARKETFAYDALGNRVAANDSLPSDGSGPVSHVYTTNNLNQYTEISTRTASRLSPTAYRSSYDANGNLTDDGRQTYRYDAFNQLVEVISATTRTTFAYDPKGRCVLRRFFNLGSQSRWIGDASNSHTLTYSDWNLIDERRTDGTCAARYIHGARIDEIVVWYPSASLGYASSEFFPLPDGLGSTVALTDANGIAIQRWRYDAFGTSTALSAASRELISVDYRFLFTGRERLGRFGLNDYRKRTCLSEHGRWTAIDPLRLSPDANLYRYVFNDPVTRVDPTGEGPCCMLLCQLLGTAESMACQSVVVAGMIICYETGNPALWWICTVALGPALDNCYDLGILVANYCIAQTCN